MKHFKGDASCKSLGTSGIAVSVRGKTFYPSTFYYLLWLPKFLAL
jgi:hypothetical protein